MGRLYKQYLARGKSGSKASRLINHFLNNLSQVECWSREVTLKKAYPPHHSDPDRHPAEWKASHSYANKGSQSFPGRVGTARIFRAFPFISRNVALCGSVICIHIDCKSDGLKASRQAELRLDELRRTQADRNTLSHTENPTDRSADAYIYSRLVMQTGQDSRQTEQYSRQT